MHALIHWTRRNRRASLVLTIIIVILLQATLWKSGDEMDTVPTITATTVIPSTPATLNFTPPFHTQGRHIIDAEGIPLKLASLNWYGASDTDYVPGGLEVQHRDTIAALIRV